MVKKSKKAKEECEHDWRPYSYSWATWHVKGPGVSIHRACRDCSRMEWPEFFAGGMEVTSEQAEAWIARQEQD